MSVVSESARRSGGGPLGDAEFDFPALGAALWRSKWKILGPTLLVAILTLIVVQIIPAKYQSESRVLIEGRDNVFLRPDADKDQFDRNAIDEQTVTSQVQLVLSRDLARSVIAKLKLDKNAEFDPALNGISSIKRILGRLGLTKDPASMTPEERVLDAYYDRLTAFAVDKSNVIVIDFLSQDPQLAANVANAIADEYLVRQRAAKQDQARTAVDWLSGEIQSMQKRVAAAEAKAAAFRGDTNLLVGPNDTTLSAQQLGDFNAQIAAARAQKADAEAKSKIIREMLKSGQPIESSDVLNSELIRRLSEQRVTLLAQLAEQSTSLGDRHPRIKELRAQIADLDQQIRLEAARTARAFENDAKIATARLDALTTNFDQLKNQAANTNERNVELRALERDAKAQRDLLESYLAKYREATSRATLNSAPANARVISRASASNIPAFPKKLPSVLIATVATLMLSCGFVLTRELLSVPSRTVATAAPRVEPRVAGPEPGPDVAQVIKAPPLIKKGSGAVAEVAESLHRAGAARIAVVGVEPGARTGEIAIKLARSLAGDGHVLLAGIEPKNSPIAAVSSDPAAKGLAELAAGDASFRDIIDKDVQSSVHVISPGRTPVERITLLSSPRLAPSFDALARTYDYIVVDAGIAEGADLEAIGEIAPQAVLLIDAATDDAVEAARQRLLAAEFEDVTELSRAGQSVPQAAAA
ncbi:MAG: exopolysaccharide transport family protein [Xanthobacteraceae bacterium]